jgi:hypothetical protein
MVRLNRQSPDLTVYSPEESRDSSTTDLPPFCSHPIILAARYHDSLVRKPLLSGSERAQISPSVCCGRFDFVIRGRASWPASIPVYGSARVLGYISWTHLILVDRVKELVIILPLGRSCGSVSHAWISSDRLTVSPRHGVCVWRAV